VLVVSLFFILGLCHMAQSVHIHLRAQAIQLRGDEIISYSPNWKYARVSKLLAKHGLMLQTFCFTFISSQ
jgi:hypothetical protein